MPVAINFPFSVSTGGIDTSDATATPTEILDGYTAYADGSKITGTIPIKEPETYTPSAINQSISSSQFLGGEQIILGDENLTPSNIKNGVSIFGITGTFEGTVSEPELISLLDCTTFTSSAEVVSAYSDLIETSSDGSYATFTPLGDYVYDTVSAIYEQSLAGVSFRAQSAANYGFYFKTPFNNKTSRILFKLIYFVSTWINPAVKLHFIAADSIDEIPTKIANQDYAYTLDILVSNTSNGKGMFFEATDAPIGTYYLFFDTPTATGGNEAILNYLGLMNL